jgi:predicted HAD superfamily phosphohydrolase YqeG
MTVYDYSTAKRRWGYSLQMLEIDREKAQMSGFAFNEQRLDVGDVLLVDMQSGNTAQWEIIEVETMRDPDDMHRFNSQFIGNLEPVAQE